MIVIHALCGSLAPCIEAAQAFGSICPDIAAGPLRAARQSEVNGMGMVVIGTWQDDRHLALGLHAATVCSRTGDGAVAHALGYHHSVTCDSSHGIVAALPCHNRVVSIGRLDGGSELTIPVYIEEREGFMVQHNPTDKRLRAHDGTDAHAVVAVNIICADKVRVVETQVTSLPVFLCIERAGPVMSFLACIEKSRCIRARSR